MSLILEALRKSEAERQRAQAPGLHAPTPALAVRRAAPGWGPWVAAALGVMLLAGTWWVGREAPAPAPRGDARSAPVPVASAPSAVVGVPDSNGTVAPPPVAAAPAPEPEPDIAAPRSPPPVPAPPAPVATRPAPVTAPAPEPTAPPPAPTESLPGLASLSTAERAALPALKVSMHVWSADPARRFAIVDGQRVGEGALLAGGTVAEIRPDGVVLDVAGRRLLLARP